MTDEVRGDDEMRALERRYAADRSDGRLRNQLSAVRDRAGLCGWCGFTFEDRGGRSSGLMRTFCAGSGVHVCQACGADRVLREQLAAIPSRQEAS